MREVPPARFGWDTSRRTLVRRWWKFAVRATLVRSAPSFFVDPAQFGHWAAEKRRYIDLYVATRTDETASARVKAELDALEEGLLLPDIETFRAAARARIRLSPLLTERAALLVGPPGAPAGCVA